MTIIINKSIKDDLEFEKKKLKLCFLRLQCRKVILLSRTRDRLSEEKYRILAGIHNAIHTALLDVPAEFP